MQAALARRRQSRRIRSLVWNRGRSLFFPREFGFERMIFPESAHPENAETNDAALLIHAFHHRIAPRRPHITVRVRKGDFEVINLRVEPQFYFIGHIVSPSRLLDFPADTPRSKSTDTTPIVFLLLIVMAKTSYFAVAGPITRLPSRWSAALAEDPSSGSLSGIGDPESAPAEFLKRSIAPGRAISTPVGRDEGRCSCAKAPEDVRSRSRGARRAGSIQKSSSLRGAPSRAGIVGRLAGAGTSPAHCLLAASFWA